MGKLRQFGRFLLRAVTWLAALCMAVMCGVSLWGTPFPILDTFCILAPAMLVLNAILLLLWLLLRKRLAVLPFLAVLWALAAFGFPYRSGEPTSSTAPDGLRVLAYNTRDFNPESARYFGFPERAVPDFVQGVSADIICIQELSRTTLRALEGYPFAVSSPGRGGKVRQGIFSVFPIVATDTIGFTNSANGAMYADIAIGTDTVRVYNVHLESFRIRPSRWLLKRVDRSLLGRISEVSRKHLSQARMIAEHQQQSPYPVIVCGDLNATSYTHTYRLVKGGLTDSYREAGTGTGSTFAIGPLPFRIDFILAHPEFQVLEHRTFAIPYSDHLPVMATLGIPKKE